MSQGRRNPRRRAPGAARVYGTSPTKQIPNTPNTIKYYQMPSKHAPRVRRFDMPPCGRRPSLWARVRPWLPAVVVALAIVGVSMFCGEFYSYVYNLGYDAALAGVPR